MRVVDGYGEYAFARHVEGAFEAPDLGAYRLAYGLAHASSPQNLVSAGRREIARDKDDRCGALARATETLQNSLTARYETIRAGLSAGLQPIFIPRTLYELLYINEVLRQEREVAFDRWLLKPLACWEELEGGGLDHASPSVSLQPATVALAHALNGVIVERLNALADTQRANLPLQRRAISLVLEGELTRFNDHLRFAGDRPNKYPCPGVPAGLSLGARLHGANIASQLGTILTSLRAAVAIELAYPGRQLLYRASEFEDDIVAAATVLSYHTGFWATLVYDRYLNTSTPEFLLQHPARTGRCVAAPYADMLREAFPFHVPLGNALDQLHGIDQQSHAWSKADRTLALDLVGEADLAVTKSHWQYMVYAQDDRNALNRMVKGYPRHSWHPFDAAAVPDYEAAAEAWKPLAEAPPLRVRRPESKTALVAVLGSRATLGSASSVVVDPDLEELNPHDGEDTLSPPHAEVPGLAVVGGKSSIVKLWEYYECAPEEAKNVTTDVYRHLLVDLVAALGKGLVLYGSAALWLEGTPRPDDSPELNIKDLDMAMDFETFVQKNGGGDVTIERALEILKGKLRAVPAILVLTDDEAAGTITMTSAGTVEIMSPDKKIQFSVNWRTKDNQADLESMCDEITVEPKSGNKSARMMISGKKFIQHRLIANDGLINRTLFRPDKTAKIVSYAAMSIALDSKQLPVMMDFMEKLIDSRWLINELKRLHLMKLKLGNPSREKQGSDAEIGVVFNTLVQSLQQLDQQIDQLSRKPRPERWRNKYGVPNVWLDDVRDELQMSNEEFFSLRASDRELDVLRDQTPRSLLGQRPRFLGKFRDDLASKFREEAQVGMKIYLLDYVSYNKDMVNRCTWVAPGFKQAMLAALGSMSTYLADKIQAQVDTSPNYN
jgi:hypothetical protein